MNTTTTTEPLPSIEQKEKKRVVYLVISYRKDWVNRLFVLIVFLFIYYLFKLY